jgi:hypothetical protein
MPPLSHPATRKPLGPSYSKVPMHDRFPTRHAPAKFEPREVLKRTGFRLGDEGKAAKDELSSLGRGVSALGAGDFGSTAGGLALTVLAGLLGLILLDLLISERGSSITSALIKWTGGALNRVVSPTDPLTSPGAGTAAPAPSGATVTASGAGASAPKNTPGGAGGATPASRYGEPLYPTPSGKIVPIPGTAASIDSAYVLFVGWISKAFGVTVTSGYRSPAANAAAGGATNSDHLSGLAVDFGGSASALDRLYKWALAFGFPYVESPAQAVALGEGPHVHISFFRPSPTP